MYILQVSLNCGTKKMVRIIVITLLQNGKKGVIKVASH